MDQADLRLILSYAQSHSDSANPDQRLIDQARFIDGKDLHVLLGEAAAWKKVKQDDDLRKLHRATAARAEELRVMVDQLDQEGLGND